MHKSQLGFLSGNRTSDAHIILNNLIRKNCRRNNSKIYSCFIDFSRAFDSIPRNILLKKLLSHNINGSVFNIIRTIYTRDKAGIKIGNKRTEYFEVQKGVRQGCVLSPLLFNIFVSDIIKEMELSTNTRFRIGNTEIFSLVWADDMVIFANSEEGLRELLKFFEISCNKHELMINTDKTKCMIF